MLSGPVNFLFLFSFFSTKFKMAESHATLKSLNCFTDFSNEAIYHGHMLIDFGVILTSHFHVAYIKIW